ncbi:MAG: DPP IV N-terminal domain-containing protein [Acidobacteria bacterium]|nr:DPP IV N-terminal domain-containing protein [Acidobacteriota bacterium]
MLSIDDIFDPQKRVRFGGNPTPLQWSKDGSLRQFKTTAGNSELLRVNALTGEALPFFDKSKLEAALVPAGITADAAKRIAGQPQFQYNSSENAAVISSGNDLYFYDFKSGTAKRLTNNKDEELEADFSPDGKLVSFVRGMNLFVVDITSGKETQLTKDGGEKILNGYLDWVYEEELYGRGNKRGYWWSPDSTRIAFLRTDENPVPKFVLVDHIPTDQRIEDTDYPQAGDANPLVKLGIVTVREAALKFVDTAKYKPEDFLISRVSWMPDSRAVIYQAQNREQTFLDVNAANCETGATTTVFTEKSPAWVEVIDNPAFLKDGTAVWQSARNGFKHLYHYDSTGKLVKQITDGRWEVRDFYGVDEKNGFVYFAAAGVDNVWNADHIYRVKLNGTGLTRLSKETGSHRASFNPTFTHYIDYWSDVNTPTQMRLYRADGTLEKVLDENRVEVLKQYALGKTEFLKVKTRDGFEMEATMIKPPDFDPSKKYPVMSYTYSGPHAPSVRNGWGGNRYMWHQMLAQKGYIIWICDNRTASGKGEEATWKVYQNMGELELRDLEDGVSYLKSLPYVDGNRIGIWGWSYGGYMTSYALTHSKNFKMGIAGGLVGDWALYDSIYTERYMKTPQNNPEGYKKSSVIAAAKDLSGKLLILHGTMDDNVHIQNPMQLIYELQKAGKQFEFMPYPTQRHGVVNPLQAKHMYQYMTDFILRNL